MNRKTLILVTCLVWLTVGSATASGVLATYTIVDPHDFSSLTLFLDGTFLYKSRGDSCWTWGDYSGQWYKRGERIDLVRTVKYSDSRTRIVGQRRQGDPNRVVVFVSDPDGLPLRDIGVTFNHGTEYLLTAADGSVFFDFAALPSLYSFEKPESKNLEILNLKSPGTTTAMTVDEKHANWFKVVYDLSPPEREEVRTETYTVLGDELHLTTAAGAQAGVTFRKSETK